MKASKGFSLVELVIVIGIFTIITMIALFDQGKLNSDVLLTNLAYDVALSARQAQSYGISVKYSDNGGAQGGYGIYVSSSTPDRVIIFHDIIADGVYIPADDGSPEKEYVFSNQRGNKIAVLCAQNTLSTAVCDANSIADQMNIVFKRPDPEPLLWAIFPSNTTPQTFSGPAYIVLKSADGTNCRAVVVEASGQIRVEGSDSPGCVNTHP